ncbi:MAG: kinase/pyrophosphorylase, partial [Candidatus Aminicenantes bacterium]|nr:kinase/pyrophosphorylase [Candidatus Aminicenantes bacterium]
PVTNKSYQRYVYAISDATGKTCETVVQAALSQFKTTRIILKTISNVRSLKQINKVVEMAVAVDGIIIYTMVSTELRQKLSELGRLHAVPTVDILGPVLTRFTDFFEISPLAQPGLFRQLDSDYFKRIESLDYTIKHDDGIGVSALNEAEIVILGVSRTTKTPVSIYLSYRGWKVANIPIILDFQLPEELFSIDQDKIIGLNINPNRLHLIRMERQSKLNNCDLGDYTDPEKIKTEIAYGLRIYQENCWPVVNVTYKSIEETATDIMRIIYARKGIKKGKM